ncbi:hypothetical protein AB0L00_38480 [Actinoallomurus sp. NPDC052308]|uniref:hypothetical protein n=1 Tax=Actinoallomurus sp. NPDC052308 TaxID=3155530 RepID=UPI003416058E
MTPDTPPYDETLQQLADERPRLAAILQTAENRRARQAAALRRGKRLHGVDELLTRLDGLAETFRSDPNLAKLTFLIRRCIADFESAAETTLSGYIALAHDAMRDVMEIEYLIRDFVHHPDNIDAWLTADDRTLRREFSAVRVRERLHAAQDPSFKTSAESMDYRGHSQSLHVRPRSIFLPQNGYLDPKHDPGGFGSDSGYWEIFEHARRLLDALCSLTGKLAPGSAADRLANEGTPAVKEAWQRTQQTQTVFMALIEAASETQRNSVDGDQPKLSVT